MATCLLLDAPVQRRTSSDEVAIVRGRHDDLPCDAIPDVDPCDDWERWPLLERIGLDGLLILTGGI